MSTPRINAVLNKYPFPLKYRIPRSSPSHRRYVRHVLLQFYYSLLWLFYVSDGSLVRSPVPAIRFTGVIPLLWPRLSHSTPDTQFRVGSSLQAGLYARTPRSVRLIYSRIICNPSRPISHIKIMHIIYSISTNSSCWDRSPITIT